MLAGEDAQFDRIERLVERARVFLVDRDTTIRPVRGVAVPIPVLERFTLPAGKAYFQFPLFQGQDPDDLGYVARLDSPAFVFGYPSSL